MRLWDDMPNNFASVIINSPAPEKKVRTSSFQHQPSKVRLDHERVMVLCEVPLHFETFSLKFSLEKMRDGFDAREL